MAAERLSKAKHLPSVVSLLRPLLTMTNIIPGQKGKTEPALFQIRHTLNLGMRRIELIADIEWDTFWSSSSFK